MPNPNEKIRYSQNNIFGHSVYVGRRTGAHLDFTKKYIAKRHPTARLAIIQGAYNLGVEASAGTHDKDACLDVDIVGMDWWESQTLLRQCGWAAWYRYPPSFTHHIHMISLGCTGPVGIYIPGQIADYYNHAQGLSGQHNYGSDPSWHPTNIRETIFDYDAYLEDDVTPADIRAIANAVWDEKIGIIGNDKDLRARAMLTQVHNRSGDSRQLAEKLKKAGLSDDLDRILEVVKKVLGEVRE